MVTFGNHVHLFARPHLRDEITRFFEEVLGCEQTVMPGVPVALFRFANNASLSIEFTEDALDEKQAMRGAWLELKTEDPSALKQKILSSGIPEVEHFDKHFHFQGPGGQMWRILGSDEP